MLVHTAKHGENVDIEQTAIITENLIYLVAKLSSGCNHKTYWTFTLLKYSLIKEVYEHWNEESKCFSASCFCDADDISTRETARKSLALYRSGCLVALLSDMLQDPILNLELVKGVEWSRYSLSFYSDSLFTSKVVRFTQMLTSLR